MKCETSSVYFYVLECGRENKVPLYPFQLPVQTSEIVIGANRQILQWDLLSKINFLRS